MSTNTAAQKLRDRLNFAAFRLDRSGDASKEERAAIKALPNIDKPITVRTHTLKCGSAYAGMREPAILAGFMRCHDGRIKALVLYTERPLSDGSYDWGFVEMSQIREYKSKVEKNARKTVSMGHGFHMILA